MNVTLWSVLAGILAVALEYLYRLYPDSWMRLAWLYIPASAAISFVIYKIVTQPGVPLVGALIAWSVSIVGARVFVTIFLLHDRVSPGTWIAVGLLVAARFAQALWR